MSILCDKLDSSSSSPLTIIFNRNWWIPLSILSLPFLYNALWYPGSPFYIHVPILELSSQVSAQETLGLKLCTPSWPPVPPCLLLPCIVQLGRVNSGAGDAHGDCHFPCAQPQRLFSFIFRAWLRDCPNLYLSPSFPGKFNAMIK
jgi:hypothetical protein